jgi:hypothetical protein
MSPDYLPLGACAAIAVVMALPSWAALQRRNRSRESSAVASSLSAFAAEVRRRQVCLAVDGELLARARRLRIPEMASFEYARELPSPQPELLAAAVHRLALRLKRRVAFERKMLARTAPGRQRALVAAASCIAAIEILQVTDLLPPAVLLAAVPALIAVGSALCWRVSRVEV